jgi:predicted phage terminase large subunit-like protein
MAFVDTIRTDFVAFVERAFLEVEGKSLKRHDYIEYLCFRIIGASNRHVINLPPRHCKTTIGAICYAAWTLGHDPSAKIIIVAGSEDLAEEIARKVRDIVRAPWFTRVFPATVLSKSKFRKMDFATTARGGVYAASIHGNITGRGADLIIVDDPLGIAEAANLDKIKKVNDIFDREVASRLDNHMTGKIVIIMHRRDEADLSGHLLEQGGWERTVLPLIAPRTKTFKLDYRKWKRRKGELLRPDAFSDRDIKQLQKNTIFQILWQQNPLGNSFRAVKRNHFPMFEEPPDAAVVLSIDTNLVGEHNGSFNVIQAWCRHEDKYFLIDQWREQCGYRGLRERALAKARKYRPAAILVERTGNGAALIDELSPRHKTISIVPQGTKLNRFRLVSDLIYSGKVLLKENAPWLEEILDELTHFPAGSHDDQMDTATQALSWLRENPGLKKPPARAVMAKAGGAPLRTDGNGVFRGPGMVGVLNSNHAPNGPFIEAKAWVEYGSAPVRHPG